MRAVDQSTRANLVRKQLSSMKVSKGQKRPSSKGRQTFPTASWVLKTSKSNKMNGKEYFRNRITIVAIESNQKIKSTTLQGPAYVSGQAVLILHPRPRCIFKNILTNTYPSYKKYIEKFHHRFMVQNLEFQIYIEKMLERPWSLFMQKRLYSIGLHIVFRTKCTK